MNATPHTQPVSGDNPLPVAGAVGIVVVDHGSRREESNRRHEAVVAAWAGIGDAVVEAAHMELSEPSIATAFERCVAAGATTVVIAPYFLGPGNHWDRDIPMLAAEVAARHPGVQFLVTAPLGPHPLLLDVVAERVRQCTEHAAGLRSECDLCAGSDHCRMR